jgi:NAD(P)-binding Rossmann-like domain
MTADAERDAVVVGAGIGGLAAAVALQCARWRVDVLERAASLGELVFALLLAPNATRALRHLGVAGAVIDAGAVMRAAEIRRSDGRLLRRLVLADALRARLGEDTVCALRSVVHGVLLCALGERSLLRTQLFGERALRYADFTAWRGVARAAVHGLGEVTARQYLGPGCEAGVARASAHDVYWYFALRVPPGGGVGAGKQEAQAHLAGFDPFFRALVDGTSDEDVRRDDVYDLDRGDPEAALRRYERTRLCASSRPPSCSGS